MQKITDIALSIPAPKTIWGAIAACCIFLDSNPDQLSWIKEDFKPAISFFVKLGAVGATFLIGAATPRPDFLRKAEEKNARDVLNDSAQPKNPIPKKSTPRKPTKKKVAKKKTAAKKTTKKYTKKKI